jgi:hypothetical protein
MADADIRWRQRFDNFERALQVLARDATRLAFQSGLIADGEGWMAMIKARHQSSPTYNLEQAKAISHDVIDRFAPLFGAVRVRFTALRDPRP